MLDEHDEDERRQQCPLCDEGSCRHLVGEGDSEYMEWRGGLSDVPEVWALISQAQDDGHILKEIFADAPPWDEIEEDQAPEDFLSEHHPRVDVCSVFWDSGSPGANGYAYHVYMTEEDQAQASKDLRRLQELILNPPAFAEAAKRSRDRDQYAVVAEMATDPVDRAYALARLGLFDDAVSCCEEALRKSPRNERAWYNLACYCARLRRKDEPAQSVAPTSTMTSGDVAGRS